MYWRIMIMFAVYVHYKAMLLIYLAQAYYIRTYTFYDI